MKKILILSLILFSLSSCDLFNPIDDCEELDHRESYTSYGVKVLSTQAHGRLNGVTVRLETWKVHCNGSIGRIDGSDITGVTGYKGQDTGTFGIPYRFGYTYKTAEDKVHFKATLSKNGEIIDEGDYIYSYNSLPPSSLIMTFYIDQKYGN